MLIFEYAIQLWIPYRLAQEGTNFAFLTTPASLNWDMTEFRPKIISTQVIYLIRRQNEPIDRVGATLVGIGQNKSFQSSRGKKMKTDQQTALG